MSSLSDFYSGGEPSTILRGSTSFNNTTGSIITVSTGVTVKANSTFLTQGCRGLVRYISSRGGSGAVRGFAVAAINGSGLIELKVQKAAGESPNVGTVDWEAIEF